MKLSESLQLIQDSLTQKKGIVSDEERKAFNGKIGWWKYAPDKKASTAAKKIESSSGWWSFLYTDHELTTELQNFKKEHAL